MEAALAALSLKPLTIVSFVLCVVAVLWCAVMMPKLRFGKDRFVVGLVGMLSVHHGFTMVNQAGVWLGAEPNNIGQWVTLGATALYLMTVLSLEHTTAEHRTNQFRLRLAEGNQAPPPVPASITPVATTASPNTQVPTASPNTQVPTASPNTQVPTASPNTQVPTASPNTQVPTASPNTQVPTASPNTQMTEAVIESSPLAMFAVDANGAICCWNTAAEKEFGWSKSEVIGRETPFSNAEQLLRRDGSEVRASIWTAPVDFHGGFGHGRLTIVASH